MAGTVNFLLLSLVAVMFVSAQTGSSCQLNQQEIRKDILECIAHEPSLFFQVMEHINNPKSMATVDFICKNQNDVVGIALCLEDKLASCYPSVKDVIKQYLPNKEHLSKALQFMCEHKKDFVENTCMNPGQAQEFMQCYMGKLGSTMMTLRSDHDIQTAMCSVIHSEEQCIKQYHGSCTTNYVDLVVQLLNILAPYCPVVVLDIKNQALNEAMGSMLVNGQPLMFQPQGEVKYNIVKS
ncbi:unnamed protein product [Candidula unifasciata]|uniref:Uncharacterized protein n=1 Tax=Candidula unifasciata TaxID=100452 RepID=A0A8S3YRA3_9EUPU|nr:unnamed protein product [Candidula unifasciata]